MSPIDRLPFFVAALWWGSLTAIGFIAVPTLFATLPTPAQAGQVAAKLFTAQAWTSLGCGMLMLMWSRGSHRFDLLGWILGGVVLAMLLQFAVVPRIVARQDLALWHSLGSGMYLLQWVCAGVLLWKFSPPAS